MTTNVEVETEDSHEETGSKAEQRTRELANNADILSALEADLREHGFAGSAQIPLIVYLAALTARFEAPVSLVIKGASGSGKSFALREGLRYIPETAFVQFHGMSEKAIAHSSDLDLKHKVLVIQEAAGRAEGAGLVLLRQLLTEGKLRYRTVASTKDGHVGRDLPTIEGPVALMMTTTSNGLHPEDETRVLSLYVDQSPEQIRRALLAVRRAYTSEDSAPWHNLYEKIVAGDCAVTIPFERTLVEEFPATNHRALRDMPKVKALIMAHALLHKENRERNEAGAVVATLDDYRRVHGLVSEALSQGLQSSVPAHIRRVVEAVYHLQSVSGEAVTMTMLAELLGCDLSTVSRNVRSSVRDGYLLDLNPGRGRPAHLIRGMREMPNDSVLPSPDSLAIRVNREAACSN